MDRLIKTDFMLVIFLVVFCFPPAIQGGKKPAAKKNPPPNQAEIVEEDEQLPEVVYPEGDWEQGLGTSGKTVPSKKPGVEKTKSQEEALEKGKTEKADGKVTVPVQEPRPSNTANPKANPESSKALSVEKTPEVKPSDNQAEEQPKESPPAESTKKTEPDQDQSLFTLEALGGIMLPRNMRIQPGGGIGFGFNLGRLIGWDGLYLTLDAQTFYGQTQLNANPFLLIDGLFGFRGRFRTGPVIILVGIEFGLRSLILLSAVEEPGDKLGYGASAFAGLEVPITDLISIIAQAHGRYLREPLVSQFYFSSVLLLGVGFSF